MFAVNAVLKLHENKIESELICFENSRIHIEAEKKNIVTHPFKAGGYFHPFISLKIANLTRKENFDIVHTQASKDLWTLVPALKLIKKEIPLILTKQVGSFIVKKDLLHKWLYKRVTYALAISKIIESNLIETTPLTNDKIKLMHNWVDTEIFDPEKAQRKKVRSEFEIPGDELVIGMLARFSWGKGHEEFLHAAATLVEKFDKLRFMIVGEASRGEEDYADKIKNLAGDLSIRDKVIFTGFRSDTPDVLSSMDIFAFPSHSEAFGIALVEAMSIGLPTVCSNSDGVLDIAVDGVTSYLFRKQDAGDLAAKLEQLIVSADKRESFGKAARSRAVNLFDSKVLTANVIELYKEVNRKNN